MLFSVNIKSRLLAVLAIMMVVPGYAQVPNGLWQQDATYQEMHGKPALQPKAFKTFVVNEQGLKSFLSSIPEGYGQARIISLPQPNGTYRAFRIWNTPMMEPALAAKYPDIQTFTAEAVDNRQVTAKIDYTPFGMHGYVFDGAKSYLIDPFSGSAAGAYIVYYRGDYSREAAAMMHCEFNDQLLVAGGTTPEQALVHGTTRRQYRLALAADSEYCIAVAGTNPTKAAVLAKMTTTMNRVNGVYEREIAVTMVFVAKMDTLIFNTTAPDPYSNNSGSAMLNQNQITVNARIGSANYDIGHVFSTGAGGIASRASVCTNNNKAKGVTGNSNPVGDAFDIDFVAHEMGHQYGANHTFNSSIGSCSGNGIAAMSFEPGSGTTIMAYAGICGADNIQQHSDAYFHSGSLEEISTFLVSTGTCPTTSASTNANATIGTFGATYAVPAQTPFELTSPTATDATADTLTYCWEQRDAGGADFGKTLVQTAADGPLFRSFLPTTSETRIFPQLSRLLLGFPPLGEKLPLVTRAMDFKVTERDIFQGWGCFNIPDDVITLNVDGNSGPFTVTSQASGETYNGGDRVEITWNVAGTAAAPVSCSAVDIFMSIDGGLTWPYTIRTATPNDGSEFVSIPNPLNSTSDARIKIKGSGNVFFNINTGTFTVNRSTVGVAATATLEGVTVSPVPASGTLSVTYPTALGHLQGTMRNTLGQAVLQMGINGSTTIDVSKLPRGVYFLRLEGNGASITKTVVLR